MDPVFAILTITINRNRAIIIVHFTPILNTFPQLLLLAVFLFFFFLEGVPGGEPLVSSRVKLGWDFSNRDTCGKLVVAMRSVWAEKSRCGCFMANSGLVSNLNISLHQLCSDVFTNYCLILFHFFLEIVPIIIPGFCLFCAILFISWSWKIIITEASIKITHNIRNKDLAKTLHKWLYMSRWQIMYKIEKTLKTGL